MLQAVINITISYKAPPGAQPVVPGTEVNLNNNEDEYGIDNNLVPPSVHANICHLCVHACVRACVHACVRACVRSSVPSSVLVSTCPSVHSSICSSVCPAGRPSTRPPVRPFISYLSTLLSSHQLTVAPICLTLSDQEPVSRSPCALLKLEPVL